jgi:AraC-like DNA-binding protein
MVRRVIRVEPGLLRIEQRLRVTDIETGTDASGPLCVLAAVEVTRGEIRYRRGSVLVTAPRRYTLFLPPFALVQAVLTRCEVTSVAIAFRPSFPDHVLSPAARLCPGSPALPASRLAALRCVRSLADDTSIDRGLEPGRLARSAKGLIDSEYGGLLRIGELAVRLRTSPAALSRAFTRAYGIPPVRYRHHVRVMDALMRFSDGALPADVFQDVGFEDLSRFYKVFRKITCAPPGAYRLRVKKRQDVR